MMLLQFEDFVEKPKIDINDIEEYIATIIDPKARAICSAVLLDGEKIYTVAYRYNMSSYRVRRIIRSAMRPIAIEYGIVDRRPRRPTLTRGKGTSGPPTAACLPGKYSGDNTHFLSARPRVNKK